MTNELSPANPHSPSRLFAWVPLLVFALWACAIGATGYFVFNRYQEGVKKEAHDTLGAIADLRVNQVADWRRAYKKNAEVMARDPQLAMEIERWLQRGTPLDSGAQRIAQRLKAVQQAYDFQGVFILDERGVVRDLPVTPDAKPPTAYGVELVMEAMRTKQAILTDLHPGAETPRVRLDLVVPIFAHGDARDRAIAGIYFRIDPQRYLFPLLQTWPTPSPSAEAILARREGDEVVVLNNLRQRDNTALQLRLPVTEKKLLTAMMARGKGGLIEGADYRGIPVIGAAKKIPDSPWFLIAKMDKEELYAPIRRTAWIVAILAFAFITGAGVATGLWWRQQRAQFLARHYEGKLKRQVLEQKYNALTRYANDIILMMDDTGRIIEANERAIQAYGHSRDELLRMNARDLQAPEALAAFDANWDRCGVEGLVYETVHRYADQSVFPVEVSARSIETEGKHFRQAIIRDITERKQAEQQLRLAALVFEGSHEAIFITDAQNHIVSVNQAFLDITGYDRAEVLGQSPSLLKSGRHDAEFFRSMMNSIHQSGHWQGEIWNKRKNGEIYPAWMAISTVRNEQGEIAHYAAIYSDISELKAAEQNLRLWGRAMESSVNAIFIVDARQENFPVFYVNSAFERTTGYASKEVVGKSCRLLDSGELNQPQIGNIYQAIREQHDGSAVLRSYRKDG
ncbi:MAG: PAS domain S-box protein, partial [Sulfuricella sp.]|nr:PAS domain S-box protein [Sulfuricella sp.]